MHVHGPLSKLVALPDVIAVAHVNKDFLNDIRVILHYE